MLIVDCTFYLGWRWIINYVTVFESICLTSGVKTLFRCFGAVQTYVLKHMITPTFLDWLTYFLDGPLSKVHFTASK